MKLKYYLIICLFFFGCSDQESVPEVKSYLFIIAGQSNALGRASNDEMPKKIKNHLFSRTKIWTVEDDFEQSNWPNYTKPNYIKKGSNWENLNINLTQSFGQELGQHGLEPYLAYNFEKYNSKDSLFIIKFSYGGIGLNFNKNFLDWSPESKNEMFEYFQNKYVGSHLKNSRFIYKGFFWSQGETDAQSYDFSKKYHENLSNFFLELGNNSSKIRNNSKFIAQCVNYDSINAPFTNQIRLAQKKFCNDKINNAILIECDTISKLKDEVHFSHLGYNSLSEEILIKIKLN